MWVAWAWPSLARLPLRRLSDLFLHPYSCTTHDRPHDDDEMTDLTEAPLEAGPIPPRTAALND